MTETTANNYYGKIAVVGMSGRYPGSNNLQEFWDNILAGKDCVSRFTPEEMIASGVPPERVALPNYVGAGGVYDRPFDFDAAFFGYNPREAELMDPQQRVFLEHCWSALENSGYDSLRAGIRIGVYAGCGISNYLFEILGDAELMRNMDPYAMMTTNDRDFLATRVGYKLDLRGPCVTVQTACSTSMVAIAQGAQSLLNYQSDMVLAGGVSINSNPRLGYLYREGGITAPDGLCRTFDAAAKGTVWAAGVGVVALKRLEDAIADRDSIHAVILGFGMSNDGAARVGFTAPGVEGQVLATLDALSMANIGPETVSFVECHGTGTPIGDPIEIAALTEAYRKGTDKRQYCAVASVKTNIGHADAAAGAAGFIKSVYALKARMLPASLNYSQPNPQIDFEASPFFVNTALKPWEPGAVPRRVGINSFGMGGTNVHMILEEAPPSEPVPSARPAQLLVWSARSPEALSRMTRQLGQHLQAHDELELADAAYTLQQGRRRFANRSAFVARARGDLTKATSDLGVTGALTVLSDRQDPPVCFMFPGQGAQHVNMARALYVAEAAFRDTVDLCCERLKAGLGVDLRELLFPSAQAEEEAAAKLSQTAYTQPALFVIEYALARLWLHWGVKPSAMIGHSVGEYVAACLAGVFSLDDALSLIALRGCLIQALPPGGMTSILAPVEQVERLLGEASLVSVASINTPSTCVVSGPLRAIALFEQQLDKSGLHYKRLQTSHAFHSSMMSPACASFRTAVGAVTLKGPAIPYLSNVTGTWITDAQATDPGYWVEHLLGAVRFSEGLSQLVSRFKGVLLEVGPSTTLTGLVNQHPAKADAFATVASLPGTKDREQDAFAQILLALGRLWCEGVSIDWTAVHAPEQRRRVPLPTYSFDHQSYRIFFNAPQAAPALKLEDTPKRADIADWFSVPSWKRTAPVQKGRNQTEARWLIFMDDAGLGRRIANRISAQGGEVISVSAGTDLRMGERAFTLRPGVRDDYFALTKELRARAMIPQEIIHLWATCPAPPEPISPEHLDASLEPTFYSLLFLAAALATEWSGTSLRLHTVSGNAHHVLGSERISPINATVTGPTKSLSREHSTFHSHWIDVDPAEIADDARNERLARDVLTECLAGCDEEVVAYRNGQRWTQRFEPLKVNLPPEELPQLRPHGVYVIVGGMGGIGLALAHFLAQRAQASLVLVGRSQLPPRTDWDVWLTTRGENDSTSERIREVRALEAKGARVLVVSGDVSNTDSMRAAIAAAKLEFGQINGVINASGVAGKGMMALKTREIASLVLAPKIHGTVVLDLVLKDEALDFFVNCSSLLSVLGEVGQSDYCSANAFVGAFSHARLHRGKVVPFTIDWDRWDEVGMAVDSVASLTKMPARTDRSLVYSSLDHHFFDARFEENGESVYVVHLDANKHWLVSEHYLGGQPAMVGTGYVESARSAFALHKNASQVEIRDLVFTGALMMAEGERREMQVRLRDGGVEAEFTVQSLLPEGSWQTHAMGKIRALHDVEPAMEDLEAIRSRCTDTNLRDQEGEAAQLMRGQSLVKVSDRWSCMQSTLGAAEEGLAVLALQQKYADDLDRFVVHPALMDAATAFPVQFASRGASYLPFSYNRIRILRPMTERIVSYARFKPAKSAGDEFLSFDVLLTDDAGKEILRIDGYGMKRVNNVAAPGQELRTGISRSPVANLKFGSHLLTHEGVEVFRRALSLAGIPGIPQLQVSTKGMEYYLATAEKKRNLVEESKGTVEETKQVRYPRPSLTVPYLAPRTPVEEAIAAIWQEIIGLDQVGVLDDFTQLGGHSLLAIQLTSRVRQEFEMEMSVATFYNNPTVAGMAAALIEAMVSGVDEEAIADALEAIDG